MGCFDFLTQYSSVSIIGMCKNAGKTTALNRIIHEFIDDARVLALTSIGRDGESSDLVTKTPKPRIYIYEGTIIATAQAAIQLGDITREILDTTGIMTPMGEVIIIRALSDGYVQIAGPSTVEGLIRTSARMRDFGAERTIIDGAISRKSLSTPELCQSVILCTGASYAPDMVKVVKDTAFTARLLSTQKTDVPLEITTRLKDLDEKYILLHEGDVLTENEPDSLQKTLRRNRAIQTILINGALTDAVAAPVLESGRRDMELITENPSKLLLSRNMYERLNVRDIRIRTIVSSTLSAITINPYSAYGIDFDEKRFKNALLNELAGFNCPIINALTGEVGVC